MNRTRPFFNQFRGWQHSYCAAALLGLAILALAADVVAQPRTVQAWGGNGSGDLGIGFSSVAEPLPQGATGAAPGPGRNALRRALPPGKALYRCGPERGLRLFAAPSRCRNGLEFDAFTRRLAPTVLVSRSLSPTRIPHQESRRLSCIRGQASLLCLDTVL